MRTDAPFYVHLLKESFSTRQRKNSSYSLRAFAKDLEIDSSNLSAILRKKRGLPPGRAKQMARKLNLPPKEAALFISSTVRKQNRLESIKLMEESKKYLLDDKYYRVIAEWEYYAFLQLLDTADFSHDPQFISRRLGISLVKARQVIEGLISLGLVAHNAGRYVRLTPSLETSEDIESSALQASHADTLKMALEKLDRVPVEERDYSSVTIAINPGQLPAAKAIIREFQEKLYAILSVGPKTEVYQFSSQLFPLTQRLEKHQ